MPRLQFSTILTRVKAIANVTSQDALIKDAIQMGLDRLTDKDLPYLMTEGVIYTVAPYETGTVTATNASKTITGSGTTFTAAMVGRKIRVGNDNAYYRIKTFNSTTSIDLDTPYGGDTVSGDTFSIYKDEYRMPANMDVYKLLRQIENSNEITSLEPTAFDIDLQTPSTQGIPKWEILKGTELDTYTTGTVSGTVNGTTITGSSTAWLSVEGLGNGSRITVVTNVYTIKSVDSDTQVTIYELISATFSATTYIAHLDNYIIQLYPIPDSAKNIYFRYQRIPFPLINDQDIPDLPEKYHSILITAGLIWAWKVKDKEESLRTEQLFESQKQMMWDRIGFISHSRIYKRRSQDDIAINQNVGSYPNGYSIPRSL